MGAFNPEFASGPHPAMPQVAGAPPGGGAPSSSGDKKDDKKDNKDDNNDKKDCRARKDSDEKGPHWQKFLAWWSAQETSIRQGSFILRECPIKT